MKLFSSPPTYFLGDVVYGAHANDELEFYFLNYKSVFIFVVVHQSTSRFAMPVLSRSSVGANGHLRAGDTTPAIF
jgi:hypothetical protein